MIIGLTGQMGCGKGEVVKILEGLGFQYITLSQMVREEAQRRGESEEREKLMEIGNSMRHEHGTGVLAKKALEKIKASQSDKWVVDGIRNPAEIEELRKADETSILALNADEEILINRILGRGRDSESKDREEIRRKLHRENGEGEPEDGQQVGKCIEMADFVIRNESTLDDLNEQFMAYYNSLRMGNFKNRKTDSLEPVYKRPTKDEYYMDLAKSVSRRGTCTKVEIGAVIIRGDQVVATGYCGAPRGTKDSLQHGFCLRKKLNIPSGHRYEMCRSVHAEQNAIINAARAGTSLFGGDMYIYGRQRTEQGPGEVIDAFPCFICKKMLINCGLNRVICSLKEGGIKVFHVEDWVKEWKENDIIDDKYQYGERTDS